MTKFGFSVFSPRLAAYAVGATVCLGLLACTSPTPRYDAQEGDALQRAKQNQTVLPTPAQRRAPAPAVTSAEVQRAVNAASTGQQLPPALTLGSGTSTGGTSTGSTGTSAGSTSTTLR